MCLNLFSEKVPCGSINLVNDHSVFAFWVVAYGRFDYISLIFTTFFLDREEKSLHHVVMVAKFLDDNKPKIHLKSKFAPFQTSSLLFNFI